MIGKAGGNMEYIPFEGDIRSLVSYAGFDAWVTEMYKILENWQEAYESIETIYFNAYGTRKYTDYNSYRVCRARRLKKKQKSIIREQ